jgi:hypothetical protein
VAKAKLLEHKHVAATAGELVRSREPHDPCPDDDDVRFASHPHILLRVIDARRALLTGLIDDAGLFPPASLSMVDALAGHFAARASEEHWILGRFLCPASRLDELSAALPADRSVRLGIVLDTDELPEPTNGRVVVETVEGRDSRALFVEVSFDDGWASGVRAAVAAVAERGTGGMKIRCGGATAAAFPSPEQVAFFIAECRSAGVPFKATAGLHEPFRHLDPESGFTHHGFLNLLTAAALEVDEAELVDVLADEDAGAFSLDRSGLRWRGHIVDPLGCERARRFFVAYGSCSFSEPVDALKAHQLL